MEWYYVIAIMVGSIAALMMLGVPVAFAFLGVNIVGSLLFMGGMKGLNLVVADAASRVTVFTLAPIPLFMLMGELFFRTGLALKVFDTFELLLGLVPGRLAYLTVVGGTFFSALTGSSLANTAMLGTLMLPEMMRRGYKRHMAMGPIMGTGGLAMIIPPSGLAVLLGSIANVDVGALLVAGFLPGLLLATFYSTAIFLQIRLDPEAAPQYASAAVSFGHKIRSVVVNVLPMGLVIFAVVGFIVLGWATPTEAAAFGAAAVVVLGIIYRRLNWTIWWAATDGALRVAGMVFIIIIGSSTFSQLLAYTGATQELVSWVTGFNLTAVELVACMFGVLLFLGTFMEQASMLMLTVPIFYPVIRAVGLDPVWFGIIMLLGLEMSLTTPPLGLLLFVMMSVAPEGTTLWQVAGAALPYLCCDATVFGLLVAFPQIALFLPGIMAG